MKPPVKKSSLLSFNWFYYFLAIIFTLSSCNFTENDKPSQISKDERAWMEKFFNDLMLFESGIYTLWGSKPITLVGIPHYTEDELKTYIDSLKEEDKKNGLIVENYSLPETWEKWEKISDRFPMNRYLLFRSELYESPKASFIFFVDILKTAIVIEENYAAFRKVVGFDFNPLEVVLDIKNKDSAFWLAIRDHRSSALWGLLFGFGKTNAYAFHWKHFEHPEKSIQFFDQMPTHLSQKPLKGKINFSIHNFEIPAFVSFDENDEIVERYQSERDRIRKIYRGKDFLELTLRKLTNSKSAS
jgi:hypothetical protein